MKFKSKGRKIAYYVVLALFIVSVIYLKFSDEGNEITQNYSNESTSSSNISLDNIPEYIGNMSVAVNDDVPFFTDEEMNEARERVFFEEYGNLDSLGRCTAAYDCLGKETMPASGETRGDISDIHPTGWHQARYDCVDQETVMTRTHLVGWMMSAENDNKKNLITGTRYMNADAMLEYEEIADDYIYHGKNKHVLYRVTPIFVGNELMARGVLMEAKSVEDNGKSVLFCRYMYNVQPGVYFDYATGKSKYCGIFFDIEADSVYTGNIDLMQYVMDMDSKTIHNESCSALAEVDNCAYFYGDIDMTSKWGNFGYHLCDKCM